MNRVHWDRYSPNGYEVSTAGDFRFSALHATLLDGRTIEEAYQLDVKGYRANSNDWHAGKGKPPLNGKNYEQLWPEYFALWQQWARENPGLIDELRRLCADRLALTDRFASTGISQARALAAILNAQGAEDS